jgi:Cu2+-exporting ATPase
MDIAGRIESASAHPLARAFPRPSGVATDVRVVAGMGIEARVDGRHCRLGQADFAAPGIRVDSYQAKDTEIWLADDGGWLARFTICDSLRKDAARAVAQLAADDLEISILSGDSEAAVKRVAELAGIDDWQARQSPENKQQQIESMKNRGQSILMVGDGVNDAPVLTTADASMTVKGGSELANSVADLILTGDSLMLVVTARDVAKQSQALIHQNLAWALLYNVSVLPLAVSGMLQPWMAALGMSLSSLVVVINATRLVRRTSHQPEAL